MLFTKGKVIISKEDHTPEGEEPTNGLYLLKLAPENSTEIDKQSYIVTNPRKNDTYWHRAMAYLSYQNLKK